MAEAAVERERWWLVAAGDGLAAVAVLVHALAFGSPVLVIDDAYITAHNASILFGADPRFPGSSGIDGATSPIHLLLVSLGQLVLSPEWSSYAVCAVGAVLYGAGLGRLGDRLGLSAPLALGGVVVGLAAAQGPHQLFNGLETGLAAAAVAWVLAETAADPHAERDVIPVLCGLLPFVRPELAMLAVLLLGERAWRRGWSEPARARLGRDLVLALFAGAPLAITLSWSTGSPIPGTVEAKRLFFAEGCWDLSRRFAETGRQLTAFATFAGLSLLLLLAAPVHRCGRLGLAFVGLVLLAFTIRFPGALGHNTHRYLVPLVPVALTGLAVERAAAGDEGSPRSWLPWLARAALLVALVDAAAVRAPRGWSSHRNNIRFSEQTLVAVSEWANRELPTDAVVLVHDVGHASHRIERELVDMVGLKTPDARILHRVHTWPSCGDPGRGEAIHDLAIEREVTHAVLFARWDRIFQITAGLQFRGWRVRLVSPVFAMEDADAPDLAYAVFALEPPLTRR